MEFIKEFILKIISFGLSSEIDDDKRTAIQIANFDAYASLITFALYAYSAQAHHFYRLAIFHATAFVLCIVGIRCLSIKRYDLGRILVHLIGLAGIFLTVDGVGETASFEFYYFAPILVPFVTFTASELKKSITLSGIGMLALITQQIIGNGHFSTVVQISSTDRSVSIAVLLAYVFGLFSVSRIQMNNAQKKIKEQQATLVHFSNIASLGVMAGGIAHEINNPLQILTTRLSSLKKLLTPIETIPPRAFEQISGIEKTVNRISVIVNGLRNLSRNVADESPQIFNVSDSLNDVLIICTQKMMDLGVTFKVTGSPDFKARGHSVQFSQVILNLLNNSLDALESLEEKWIFIDIIKSNEKIKISVIDSGNGIPDAIADKIMNPFYTTKEPNRGTGLGLSISNSIIERSGGKLYYDKRALNTTFVIELPVVVDS